MDHYSGGVRVGSTSVSIFPVLRKKSDNTEATGVVRANVTAYYRRQGFAPVAIVLTDLPGPVITDVFTSGAWFQVSAANRPGEYRLDVPDAAWATGADAVTISLIDSTDATYVWYREYPLTSVIPQDLWNALTVHAGTAQAAAAGPPSTLTFDTGASNTVDFYCGMPVYIYGGAGAGQVNYVKDKLGASYYTSGRVATMAIPWLVLPDNTSQFVVLPGNLRALRDMADAFGTGLSERQVLAGIFDSQYGKNSGGGAVPGPWLQRNKADTKTRASLNYDVNGNRTANNSFDFTDLNANGG